MACPACFSGSLNDEKPTGTTTTIHGLPTYVARPENNAKGLVVIIPDAFGWDTPNIRVLADRYAKNGDFLVYVPDFMSGHACSLKVMYTTEKLMAPASWFHTIIYKPFYVLQLMAGFIPFLLRCRPAVTKSTVFEFFRQLRTSPDTASMKVGAAGFCWGGKHTIWLAHDYPSSRVHRTGSSAGQLGSLIDAAFTAHPSFLKIPEDADNIRIPTSIMVGDNDMALKLPLAEQAKAILEKKKETDHEVVISPGAVHGFAVRGLLSDPKQKAHSDAAEKQAIDWFTKYLA